MSLWMPRGRLNTRMRYFEFAEGAGEPRLPGAPRRPKPAAGTTPPLTPEQARRAADRRNTVQRQLRDESQRHNAKVNDLHDMLSSK
ncbi:hypothetical protein SAMN02799631_05181 [Methylobacterium sp. 174MFSha1.1]|nr:hypothetical protein SAMN02799631_05181 [Methylobacterium sp. 174MFSha1.1]